MLHYHYNIIIIIMIEGPYAFSACIKLSSINIPTSVVSIQTFTFYATALRSITISSSVTSIDSHAFFYSTALTSVSIPTSVTNIGIYHHRVITICQHHIIIIFKGAYAFYPCPFTCIIDWNPTTVRTIGYNALPTTTTCGTLHTLLHIFITYISTYIKRKLL